MSSINCDTIARAGMFVSQAPGPRPNEAGSRGRRSHRSIEQVRSPERRTVSGPYLAAKASRDYRLASASIPPRTQPASALRCPIASGPRCCIA